MNEENKNKKIKKAAAIKYDVNDKAPSLIAKGMGDIAGKIIERGEEAEIPVFKDEKLVETLTQLELGDYIPKELYKVVAEIMIFVTDVDKLYDKYNQ